MAATRTPQDRGMSVKLRPGVPDDAAVWSDLLRGLRCARGSPWVPQRLPVGGSGHWCGGHDAGPPASTGGRGRWAGGRQQNLNTGRNMARPGTASADDASESVSPSSGAGRRELRCTLARNRHVSRAVALFAAAALAVSLSACSSTAEASKGNVLWVRTGPRNGKVKTYVVTGDDGKPTELGFAFDAATPRVCPNRRTTEAGATAKPAAVLPGWSRGGRSCHLRFRTRRPPATRSFRPAAPRRPLLLPDSGGSCRDQPKERGFRREGNEAPGRKVRSGGLRRDPEHST